ncbi:MAG: YjjI family glycine radical enzyme [Myxococcota bacterium]|jgi:YjjI family glycine radical enzyme|nr:YjjI family glycine radical enzyme [Myxococcota bacterium]
MSRLSAEAHRIATDASLDERQRRAQLARLAESTIKPMTLRAGTWMLLDKGVLCDLFEGPAPARPRYVLPDYARALRQGCAWLELEAPRAFDEALSFLSILYQHVPSVTGYPVWLGHVDSLLEPFAADLDDTQLNRQLRLFWRALDRCLPNAFVHANLGPEPSRVGRAILQLERELRQVVPNLSLLVDPTRTPDAFLLEAIQCCFDSAKPHFVNHPLVSRAFERPNAERPVAAHPYGVASCYNSLPVGGGSYTLVRLNLARAAEHFDGSIATFLDEELPRLVEAGCELLAARSRYAVEQSPFFGHNGSGPAHFLVAEGLVQQERFGAMFGLLGMAELCNSLLAREYPMRKPRYGRHREGGELGQRVLARLVELIAEHPIPHCSFNQGRAWLHAQSGIDSDQGSTPGTRIPFDDEPELLEHLRAIAPMHAPFEAGASDPLRLDSTVRQNPRAVLELMRGAFSTGLRDFTFDLADSELMRVTGYLVRRSELPKLGQSALRHDSTLLSGGAVRERKLLERSARRVTGPNGL